MGFTSQLYKNEIILDDDTPGHVLDSLEGFQRGLDLSLRGTKPFAYVATADPFNPDLLIPPSDYRAWIQEAEESKSRISDLITQQKLPPKRQTNVNYCWSFCTVHAVEILYALMHNRVIDLSATAVAAQIKNYANVGGWPKDAVKWIAEKGAPRQGLWPDNIINKKYATAATAENALQFRVEEWTECAYRNPGQQISMLLRRFPAAAGRMHWEHATTDCEVVWLDGAPAIRTRNQWPGSAEWVIMRGTKLPAEDFVCPRSVSAIGGVV